MEGSIRIAVSGCQHGELDALFAAVAAVSPPVALLVCCGDFQAVRCMSDLECMACPAKYKSMQSFWRYYAGLARAPVPVVFVGGNHEAANHLQALRYGGWASPRVHFLGSSGAVFFGGLRIGGVSGIFKGYDFATGFHERAPFSDDALRSVNHQREFDFWRLQHLRAATGGGSGGGGGGCFPIDVFLSHDWPEGVYRHGDLPALLRAKRHFEEDVARGALGSPPAMQLLRLLRPRFWFAGHLHVKFAALIVHDEGEAVGGAAAAAAPRAAAVSAADDAASSASATSSSAAEGSAAPAGASAPAPAAPLLFNGDGGAPATRFLALDKPLPGRQFLQVLDIPLRPGVPGAGEACFAYDAEWLAVLARTHALEPAAKRYPRLPAPSAPSAAEIAAVEARLRAAGLGARDAAGREFYPMPENFSITAPPFVPSGPHDAGQFRSVGMPGAEGSPQTDALLRLLGLPHGLTVPFGAAAALANAPAQTSAPAPAPAVAFVGAAASGAAVVRDANEIALD